MDSWFVFKMIRLQMHLPFCRICSDFCHLENAGAQDETAALTVLEATCLDSQNLLTFLLDVY